MEYEVIIYTEINTVRRFKTKSLDDFLDYKKTAHDRAVKCLPFDQYDNELKHMVYYHEVLQDKNLTEVTIYMNPTLVDDKLLDDFVDTWKPIYVGAIHRRD